MRNWSISLQAFINALDKVTGVAQKFLTGIRITADYNDLRQIVRVRNDSTTSGTGTITAFTVPENEVWWVYWIQTHLESGTFEISDIRFFGVEGDQMGLESEGGTTVRYMSMQVPRPVKLMPQTTVRPNISSHTSAGTLRTEAYIRKVSVQPPRLQVV